ncbi:PDZ domain-containing protein [Rossellomorea vietnamensis]|uniref:C-terminal processing peptidase n=1 Tax=Rossellomorea vietnamensis TaxID=218284 RepID=A0A5D4KGN3_9BACI|nr:S41 family peptidase [Rossellomorea vietnamensis]TYR76086.1 PDZ domain-containing protein [Rossellomorea vietnamensis]
MEQRKGLIIIAAASLLAGAGGMYGGMSLLDAFERDTEDGVAMEGGPLSDRLHKVEVAYDLIADKYVEEVDKGELVEGAIQGMLDTLEDPYSVYMDARTASQFNDSLGSSFQGIGAEVTVMDGKLLIVAPFKDSPAEKAGLRPNDQILKVDGETITGLDLYEATLKIRGEKGSKVELEIMREGLSNPVKVSVKRDEIPLETVHSDIKNENGKHYGVIEVSSFSENTSKDFKKQLSELEEQGLAGLVIDVRGNPGGLLSSVNEMLDELVTKDKPYVQVQERNGDTLKYFSENKEKKAYPITVLVDEGSASASEILAGALKEAGDYPLIGTKTFGKGTVQQPVPMGDGSNIKLTMFKWLTPEGNWIHKKGIEPNIHVKQPAYFYAHPLQAEKPLVREMNNEQVKNAQEMLQGLGYKPARSDGYFNNSTETAVKSFQKKHGLEASGKIDSETASKLQEEIYKAVKDEKNDVQLKAALEYLKRVN